MTVEQAENIARELHIDSNSTEEEIFMFTEAMRFLIEKLNRPQDMLYLGGYYYEIKNFDLALKYYEMAAALDYDEAYNCLGYIWYYGRTGERDYKRAFECFDRLREKGDLVATYKVADMYRNGYYVEKNQAKYEEMIEDLYVRVQKCKTVYDPIPEVFTRLARIRTEQGREIDAVELYLRAKNILARRISLNAFFGNLNIMKWMIDDLYELIEFDEEDFDFFDLYYVLKSPHKVTFCYKGNSFLVESVQEGEECSVCFNGKWYRGRDEFFAKANANGIALTEINEDLYDFEIIE